jgi:hypothetical protein
MAVLLYLKTRKAGGESLREASDQFEALDIPRSKWQARMKSRTTTHHTHREIHNGRPRSAAPTVIQVACFVIDGQLALTVGAALRGRPVLAYLGYGQYHL